MRDLMRRLEKLEREIANDCSCRHRLVICGDETEIPPQTKCPTHGIAPRLVIIEGPA